MCGKLELTRGRGQAHGEASNRTEIVHDLCLGWMGGSCVERLEQFGGVDAPGAMFAAMVYAACFSCPDCFWNQHDYARASDILLTLSQEDDDSDWILLS